MEEETQVPVTQEHVPVGAGFLARHYPEEFERLASLGDYANEYE